MLPALLWLFDTLVGLIIFTLIVNAVLSWLIAFEVINRRNRVVSTVFDLTQRLTDPLLAPIRRVIPLVGGVDLSPIVLVLGLGFIQTLVHNIYRGNVLY